MLQDIQGHRLSNEFSLRRDPRPEDAALIVRGSYLLMFPEAPVDDLPAYRPVKVKELGDLAQPESLIYLFAMDETAWFLVPEPEAEGRQSAGRTEASPDMDVRRAGELHEPSPIPGAVWVEIRQMRHAAPKELVYAAVTGRHLQQWYRDNRYCGRCGAKLVHKADERAMICPDCGCVTYPKIAPAVIVAVTDGDRIVMTRYKGRTTGGRALIAGFCEIGETAEDTVRREVMEEVGLKVKNLRYYKSQPWGFDLDLLMGFYCELDGDGTIHRQEDELGYAEWVRREDITEAFDGVSLTNEMVTRFKRGEMP